MIWLGYPNLIDPADAAALAGAIDATPVVRLEGHPADLEPLLEHITRVGDVERFPRMVSPAERCVFTPSGPETRMATPLDLGALEDLFAGYEVQFINGTRSRRQYLHKCISNHGAIVHTGAQGINGAALTGGLTPEFLVLEHLRVAPTSRGQGISWALVSRVVEIAQAYGVGLLASIAQSNPMSMPEEQCQMETQVSVNLRLPDRVPGDRRGRRLALRVARRVQG